MYGSQPACCTRLELISYWDRLSHEGYNPDHYLRDMAERAYIQSISQDEGPKTEDTGTTIDTARLAEDGQSAPERDYSEAPPPEDIVTVCLSL